VEPNSSNFGLRLSHDHRKATPDLSFYRVNLIPISNWQSTDIEQAHVTWPELTIITVRAIMLYVNLQVTIVSILNYLLPLVFILVLLVFTNFLFLSFHLLTFSSRSPCRFSFWPYCFSVYQSFTSLFFL